MPMPKNNCRGCNNRNENCHSVCQSYLDYVAACEEIREKRFRNNVYEGYSRACSDKACRIHFGKASAR